MSTTKICSKAWIVIWPPHSHHTKNKKKRIFTLSSSMIKTRSLFSLLINDFLCLFFNLPLQRKLTSNFAFFSLAEKNWNFRLLCINQKVISFYHNTEERRPSQTLYLLWGEHTGYETWMSWAMLNQPPLVFHVHFWSKSWTLGQNISSTGSRHVSHILCIVCLISAFGKRV